MLRYWRQLSPGSRVGVGLIVLLLGIYVVRAAGDGGPWWVTEAATAQERQSLAALHADVVRLTAQRQEHEQRLAATAALSKSLWAGTSAMPTNEIQTTIERLGAQAGVRLNRVGVPRVVDLSDHLKAVEVQISAQTSSEALGRFLQAVDNQRPLLEWAACSLSPNTPLNPTAVMLTGKLRALVLVPGAVAPAPAASARRSPP